MPQLPVEIWEQIVSLHSPSKEDYAVKLPWKQSAKESTIVSLTQVCSTLRVLALPLVWAVVYVETMKDWGLLWKRICRESGQYIQAFINFWAIARLPHLCMDHLEEQGRDLLWYAFIDRKNYRLCNRNFKKNDPYRKLGNGPDGRGPDAIILSKEMFLQACKDISSTWSKRLSTIYWDASTTFPVEIMLNIRRIQEACNDTETSAFPGLEHLCIDFVERTMEERETAESVDYENSDTFEHARRMAFFREPIWQLGSTTLSKLKFFSLAPPFWPNTFVGFDNPVYTSPSRLWWSRLDMHAAKDDGYGKLQKQLRDYDEDTGPGQYYKILQSIQPEVFFSSSQSPFHCKDLLPCWARLRCIHIFILVLLTNDDQARRLNLPRSAEFLQTEKYAFPEYWDAHAQYMMLQDSDCGGYLRGAIQLRPVLERLMKRKGRLLIGEDIVEMASTTQEAAEDIIHWSEDWNYTRSCSEGIDGSAAFQEVNQSHEKESTGLSSAYKVWLKDPQLADKVAQAF